MISHYGLGFGAGVLSLLAPCVLPLLPIVFGSSIQTSKYGPLANALGLTLSFTLVGVLTSLFTSLFDINTIQKFGAILLILTGVVFLFPRVKNFFTKKLNFIGNKGHAIQSQVTSKDLLGEFFMGGILGMIWGPCSGPTLAFAFGIATQADKILHAILIFFFFGLGAGLGLVSLGFILKRVTNLSGKILRFGTLMNLGSGIVSIAIGVLILSNQLGILEDYLLSLLPDWLINLSVAI